MNTSPQQPHQSTHVPQSGASQRHTPMSSGDFVYSRDEVNVHGITYDQWLDSLASLSGGHALPHTTPERVAAWFNGVSPSEWHRKLLGNRNPTGLSTPVMVGIGLLAAGAAYFFFTRKAEAAEAPAAAAPAKPPAETVGPAKAPPAMSAGSYLVMVKAGAESAPETPKPNEQLVDYYARNKGNCAPGATVNPEATCYAQLGPFSGAELTKQFNISKTANTIDPSVKMVLVVDHDTNAITDYTTVPPTAG